MVDTIGPPTSASAGGPLGTLGSFPQFKTGGSDSRASRILEEVGIVAEIRDSAVQQLHSGSTFGRRCSSFRKSGQQHQRSPAETFSDNPGRRLLQTLRPPYCVRFSESKWARAFRATAYRKGQRLNSSHQDGYTITLWIKSVRRHPARNLVS